MRFARGEAKAHEVLIAIRQIVRRMPRQPAMLMVDVGAHTRGELATDGVLHGHPAIAFEAGFASCAALKRHTQHVAQKSSVPLTVRCVAVGSRNGTVQFGAPKTFRKMFAPDFDHAYEKDTDAALKSDSKLQTAREYALALKREGNFAVETGADAPGVSFPHPSVDGEEEEEEARVGGVESHESDHEFVAAVFAV